MEDEGVPSSLQVNANDDGSPPPCDQPGFIVAVLKSKVVVG